MNCTIEVDFRRGSRNAVSRIALAAITSLALLAGCGERGPIPTAKSPATIAAPAPNAPGSATGTAAAPAQLDFVHFRVGNRNVKHLLVDGGVLWIGTSGGLIRYEIATGRFTTYDNTSGLLSNGVFRVARIGDELHVGTYGGGLSVMTPQGTWRNFNVPQGLGDPFVYDELRMPNGDLWIATWSGVNLVLGGDLARASAWRLYTVENTQGGLQNDWVYALRPGRNGEMWLATEGGLARWVDGRWTHWTHADGLGAEFDRVKDDIKYGNDPAQFSQHHARQKEEMHLERVKVAYNPNYIVSLAVDREGVVWAGTWGGGLSRFDGKTWRTYTVKDGLPGNHVFALHVDDAGDLWIGTNDGMALRQGDKFRVYRTEDGLFSNAVFSIASAPDGSLWVGSYGGVAHLRRPR